jgi:hypothetical protein
MLTVRVEACSGVFMTCSCYIDRLSMPCNKTIYRASKKPWRLNTVFIYLRFKVLTAVKLPVTVFRIVTSCRFVASYQGLGGKLHLR